jgi:hypothetical protein
MVKNVTDIGIMMSCFDEVEAVSFAIQELRKFYPENKIFIFNESKEDYTFLLEEDKNIKIKNDEDTMSFYYQYPIHEVYLFPEFQEKIQKAVLTFLNRIYQTIEYTQGEYLLLMDPDVLIRGELNIPSNINLLGSLRNKGVPYDTKKVLESVEGAIIIDEWGATPGIFKVETFQKAYNKFISIPNLLPQLTESWSSFYAHDIIIPILFSLIGEREYLNTDFTECNSDPDWQTNKKKLVHHYKKYYKDVETKFPFFKELPQI